MPKKPTSPDKAKDIEENKHIAVLSYVWILCLVPLLLKRDSEFAQFHAKQGLVLFLAEIILVWVPIIGWAINLVILVVAIIGIFKVLQGEYWEVPYAQTVVKKLNI